MTRHLRPEYKWVPLDQAVMLDLARRDPGLFLQNHRPPVTFDEVQKAPELFAEIKYLVDDQRIKPGEVILTGSQPLQLMSLVSDSLAGRVGILELPSMSLGEIFSTQGHPLT